MEDKAFVPIRIPFGNFNAVLIHNAPDIKPHTILIDGKPIVAEYKLKILDESDIRTSANKISSKIFDCFSNA